MYPIDKFAQEKKRRVFLFLMLFVLGQMSNIYDILS